MKKSFFLFCSGLIVFFTSKPHPNLIKSYTITNKNKIVVKAYKVFSKEFIREDFFAEYDESIDLNLLDESIVTIPFILSIIPVVWVSNKIYSIRVMDHDLYYALQEIKKIFKLFYPEQKWAGELIPKKLVKNNIKLESIPGLPTLAMLFSGGLDSVDSSISHGNTKQLLITAWGSDVPLHKTAMWTGVLKQCEKFAHIYGHENIFVRSNFKEFIEEKGGITSKKLKNKLHKTPGAWWLYTSLTLSYVGLTAPILVSRNIPTLLVGSSYMSLSPYPCGTHPAIDNKISFAGSIVYHDGLERDRIQKIVNISTICRRKNLPIPPIRVCWGKNQHGGNCLNCDKCLRTIVFNIIAAGQIPKTFGFHIGIAESIEKIEYFFRKQGYLKNNSSTLQQDNLFYLNSLFKQISNDDMLACQNSLFSKIKANNIILSNLFYMYNLYKQIENNTVLSEQDRKIINKFLNTVDLEQYMNFNRASYSFQDYLLFKKLWKQNTKIFNIEDEKKL